MTGLFGTVAARRFSKCVLSLSAACLLLAFFQGSAEPAAALNVPTQAFTVYVAPGVSASWLRRSEQALEEQSETVRASWGTPLIRFGPGGWPVYVRSDRPGQGEPGWHGVEKGDPYAVVETGTWAPAAGIFDHEVLETLVDPYLQRFIDGALVEICDPVVGHRYRASNGALLVDWVYPAYFHNALAGPWDYLGVLAGAKR